MPNITPGERLYQKYNRFIVLKWLRPSFKLVYHLISFRDLLEENGYRLSDKRFMLDLIPLVLNEEEESTKQLIKNKHLGVIFDGTTWLGEALVVCYRFLWNRSMPASN